MLLEALEKIIGVEARIVGTVDNCTCYHPLSWTTSLMDHGSLFRHPAKFPILNNY
jgi:hypothetical protein